MVKLQTKSTELPPVRKTPRMLRIEQELGRDIRLVLVDLYNTYGGITQVAGELGIETSVVSIWCARLGIRLRTVAEVSSQKAA